MQRIPSFDIDHMGLSPAVSRKDTVGIRLSRPLI